MKRFSFDVAVYRLRITQQKQGRARTFLRSYLLLRLSRQAPPRSRALRPLLGARNQ